MNIEQQRLAIAKACGWHKRLESWRNPCGQPGFVSIPDYLNDLNAMHEAEKTLDANQRLDYACYLTEPVRDQVYEVMPRDIHYSVCFPAINSTAAQRAEAFLRTLNLWTSS